MLLRKSGNALVLAITSLLLSSATASSQPFFKGYEHLFLPARHYVAYQTTQEICIDGKAGERSWSKAEWTEPFADIEGPVRPAPKYNTRAKMLWDNNSLYIFAELEEPGIWAYYRQHDQIVYHENDFEVFIDPDRDGLNYFEFELNAANTLFDLFLPKPYRNGGNPLLTWDAKGFKSAVSLHGTINNPGDRDKKWTVEIAIPFESLQAETTHPVIPSDGDIWKINFSRVEWQTSTVNGKYQKKKNDQTSRDLPEDNWVWSPTGEINMHVPERWGYLQFSANPAGSQPVGFQIPMNDNLKKILWLGYYKQTDFRRKNHEYARKLDQLEMPENLRSESGETLKLNLNAKADQFQLMLQTEDGKQLSINHSGEIEQTQKQ